ncbi:hypothetical protein GCM10007884_16220 [Methylobacterium brachythecii]|uniref:Uncharacterized protein n=1 Tax=Methylobacterium brachythecii TaxID=1176177 RepID=A0ABQ6D627_9HYPH|nr:hypothetical protein GCM10007884_16220 [Methylobacterium brachythecii]
MLRLAVTLLVLSLPSIALAAEAGHARSHHSKRAPAAFDPASEARISQVPDRRSAPARPIPEGEAKNATVQGPTAPVTCNGQNASSPACYTATQQSRPVTR